MNSVHLYILLWLFLTLFVLLPIRKCVIKYRNLSKQSEIYPSFCTTQVHCWKRQKCTKVCYQIHSAFYSQVGFGEITKLDFSILWGTSLSELFAKNYHLKLTSTFFTLLYDQKYEVVTSRNLYLWPEVMQYLNDENCTFPLLNFLQYAVVVCK